MEDYNISAVAASYAQFAGLLVGFAFASLSFLIAPQIEKLFKSDSKSLFLVEQFLRINSTAFFGLIATTVLQTIRAGEESVTVRSLAMTSFVDFIMAISVLMLFSSFFLMLSMFFSFIVNFSDKSKIIIQDFDFLHNISVLLVLLLNCFTTMSFWHSLDENYDRYLAIFIWFVIPMTIYFLLKQKFFIKRTTILNISSLSPRRLYHILIISITVPMILFALVWNISTKEFESFCIKNSPVVFLVTLIVMWSMAFITLILENYKYKNIVR